MKAADLRELTLEELQAKLKELQEEIFNLNFRAASQQLDNTAALGHTRKDIARVLTVLRERESAAA